MYETSKHMHSCLFSISVLELFFSKVVLNIGLLFIVVMECSDFLFGLVVTD